MKTTTLKQILSVLLMLGTILGSIVVLYLAVLAYHHFTN